MLLPKITTRSATWSPVQKLWAHESLTTQTYVDPKRVCSASVCSVNNSAQLTIRNDSVNLGCDNLIVYLKTKLRDSYS